MRRWLTIFLLLILPVQFSWAAAAAYCQHEKSPVTKHIGHHEHEHEAAGASKSTSSVKDLGESSTSKTGKLVGDNDCGYCHLSFAKPMVPIALQVIADASSSLSTDTTPAFQSRGPDHLERPQWRLA